MFDIFRPQKGRASSLRDSKYFEQGVSSIESNYIISLSPGKSDRIEILWFSSTLGVDGDSSRHVSPEGPGDKTPKDRSWAAAKMMMNKVDQFLADLANFEKENIHLNTLTTMEVCIKYKNFSPEFIRSKVGAAAGLCSWDINILKFYEVPQALNLFLFYVRLYYYKSKICLSLLKPRYTVMLPPKELPWRTLTSSFVMLKLDSRVS